MSPQAGWRHDHSEAVVSAVLRCPACYARVSVHGEGEEAALYNHSLSGHCTAHVAVKVRAPRRSRRDDNLGNPWGFDA